MDELELLLDLDDRRKGERFALDVPLTADGFEAKILNLSENGVRFVTSDKVDGDEVTLVLGDGENQLRLQGKRVWSEPVGPGHSAVGVIFQDSDDLAKFRQLLE
ncbi:MAG: PilZ domain-containing protein [Candidatus Eremiobacteraeota bacterium]|nr:PilZ domain-containing protein [Candidatus Eremiobacteraeota bacterium]